VENRKVVRMEGVSVDRRRLLAGAAGVGAAELLSTVSPAFANSSKGNNVAGVWSVVAVSSKPGAWGPFRGEGIVDADGGFIGSNAVQPSASVGYWKALGGKYYQAVFTVFLFEADGTPAGSLKATVNLTRSSATKLTGTVTYQKIDTSGSVVSHGAGTVTADRVGP